LGTKLWMPSDFFRPGEPCACRVFVCNPDVQTYESVPVFVILDVFGSYFFAPGFGDFDYTIMDVETGETELEVLPEFPWPDGAGSVNGVNWYAAMTNEAITALFGEMDMWTFGWGE
jgi:hypothetical protein